MLNSVASLLLSSVIPLAGPTSPEASSVKLITHPHTCTRRESGNQGALSAAATATTALIYDTLLNITHLSYFTKFIANKALRNAPTPSTDPPLQASGAPFRFIASNVAIGRSPSLGGLFIPGQFNLSLPFPARCAACWYDYVTAGLASVN